MTETHLFTGNFPQMLAKASTF